MKTRAIIIDLDGTMADNSHRVHHVKKEKKDWALFNANIPHDKLNAWCYEIFYAFAQMGYAAVFVTGREGTYNCLLYTSPSPRDS